MQEVHAVCCLLIIFRALSVGIYFPANTGLWNYSFLQSITPQLSLIGCSVFPQNCCSTETYPALLLMQCNDGPVSADAAQLSVVWMRLFFFFGERESYQTKKTTFSPGINCVGLHVEKKKNAFSNVHRYFYHQPSHLNPQHFFDTLIEKSDFHQPQFAWYKKYSNDFSNFVLAILVNVCYMCGLDR